MWEGIIAGVATFLICELLRIIYKKSKGNIRPVLRNIKRRFKGEYTLNDLLKIESLPEDKRSKKQKAKYQEGMKEFELKNSDKIAQIQASFKAVSKELNKKLWD